MGNTAKQCRLGLFQNSDFAGDLEDAKSTSGGILCIFGSKTFVPMVGCARNKLQFHTVLRKLKLISLDAGLRKDGIPALDLWDLVVDVFHSSSNQFKKPKESTGRPVA